MDTLTQFIEEKIAPPLLKFSQFRYVQVMQRMGLGVMGLLIIGSLFLLVASFPITAWTDFLGDFRWVIAEASGVGTAFIGLYTVITASYGLVEWYNQNKGEKLDIVQPMILSVACFFLINPATTIAYSKDGINLSFTGVSTTYLGALGVFLALIVAIVTVEIYRFVIRRKIVIRLPEGVPPMVANAFTSLIPSLTAILFWWLIYSVFKVNVPVLITDLLKPLVAVGDSPITVVVTTLLNRILWAVGIHGSNIVSSVAGAFWTQMSATNLEAFQQGTSLVYTYTSVFIDNYVWVGLFPLALALLISKSPRLKTLGVLALVPAFFNIGEPLIFGLPIMLNPLMMIPFVLVYGVQAILAIGLHLLEILPIPVLSIPWITPAPIKTFLATNGSWMAFLFVIVSWVIMFLIFWPFVKAIEKQDMKVLEENQKS